MFDAIHNQDLFFNTDHQFYAIEVVFKSDEICVGKIIKSGSLDEVKTAKDDVWILTAEELSRKLEDIQFIKDMQESNLDDEIQVAEWYPELLADSSDEDYDY
jgi:inorganic pyrophosphatase